MTKTIPARGAALVTGGARRMGRAFVDALAEDGYRVIVHFNTSGKEAEEAARDIESRGGRAIALGADLSDPAAAGALVARARQEAGPIEVLVNSASIFEDDTSSNLTPESFRRHMEVNTLAPALLSRDFAALAADNSGGSAMILNVLDYKLFNINADYFSYTLSKAALKTMTEMLAREFAPKVRVNALAPGLTLPSPYHDEDEFERLHDDNPLRCGPRLEDMVRTLRYFLATPSVSGQILAVDGGQHFDPRLTRDVFGAL